MTVAVCLVVGLRTSDFRVAIDIAENTRKSRRVYDVRTRV
jgi:hypothetical protein